MICSCCGIDKPVSEFYKTYKQCKACTIRKVSERTMKNRDKVKAYHHQYYLDHQEESKKWMKAYRERIDSLKTPCKKCGENRPWVIDFHHINPAEKKFNIPRKTAITDFEIVKAEVSKCICLCRNCHQEFHYFYGSRPKNPVEAINNYLAKENKQ